MADNLYVPQVDYTSRDFLSISNDMKALIPNFAPQWTSRDATDFGIVLVELFAYMGDLLNYYIDRAANESFIETSTQRDTVIKIAQMLNYTPNDVTPATGTITLTNTGSTSAVTVKKGSQFSTTADGTGNQVTFELDADTTVSASSTASATVTQGITVNAEAIGVSDGNEYQSFKLANPGVITAGAITVAAGGVFYQKVQHVIDYGPSDPVFSVYTDGTGYTYVQFGDGISGRIPPTNVAIAATYRYTDTAGSLGNIQADTLTNVVGDPNGQPIDFITVTNPTAFSGGVDAESTDSIRVNAPLALRTLGRAVSLSDYSNLAIQVSGVAKANAAAATYTQVILYLAATGGNPSSQSLKTSVYNYLSDKIPPNTSLIIRDFIPAYPYLNLTVNVLPQYDAAIVKDAVTAALYSLFSFDNVVFNDLISIGDIHAACRSVAGVAYVTISDFEKLSVIATSPTLAVTTTDMVCNVDEVPILEPTYIIVNTTGGIA